MGSGEMVGVIVLGLIAGVLSGLLGIGGAIIVIPCLVLIRGFSQQQAAGTSLAMMLPPIGVFAVIRYYRAGAVDIQTAAVLAVVFAIGAYLGAMLVSTGKINDLLLRRIFGFFLLYVAAQILIKSNSRVRAAFLTVALMGVYAAGYWGLRAIGKRWERKFDIRATYQKRLAREIVPEYQI